MVAMDSGDLLTEVGIFLKVTLAEEKLSDHAECSRQKLIACLGKRDMCPSHQAYIDMNGGSSCHTKIKQQISNCYEEFDRGLDINTKNKSNITECSANVLYNNLTSVQDKNIYNNDDEAQNYINIRHVTPSQMEDNPYINPSSPLANTPVIPTKPLSMVKSPSNSNSERNSVISFKKDSPDRISVSSSSLTSCSMRCEESPDVLATSASAMRYAASKTGLLGRKEKFFFVDHIKQYWVALLHQTLYIFSSDKDNKPVAEMDISEYKARPVGIVANTKAEYKFELVSPGKKTHQFWAEKQSDMEGWILALNAATRPADSVNEWGRRLPSLPAALNTYDQLSTRRMTCPVPCNQPDSDKRPLIEPEYELPASQSVNQSQILALNKELTKFLSSQARERKSTEQLVIPEVQNGDRRSSSGRQSASPRETRQLPLLPHQELEMYDQPEPTVRPVNNSPKLYESLWEEVYHCIDDSIPQRPKEPRCLPLLPHEQEMYDQLESTIRPVNNPDVVQEEFYSVIDGIDDIDSNKPTSQEVVYKNVEELEAMNQTENESNYYNLVPYPERETDQECIYDVITEQRQLLSPSPINDIPHKPLPPPTVTEERTARLNEKRVSTSVNNIATIFSRPFSKPQLREVKPPIINKSYQ